MTSSETESKKLDMAEYKERLKKHEKVFRMCLEYKYGLKSKIEKIFSGEEMEVLELKDKNSIPMEFKEFLLKELFKRIDIKDYEKFMEALTETFQSHLVNVILKDGVFDAGDINIPLTVEQRNMIRHKKDRIVDNLHTLVVEVADECKDKYINVYHYQEITKDNLIAVKKAEEMVDIMKNRSVLHFQSIREALKNKEFPDCEELLGIGITGESDIGMKVITENQSGKMEELKEADAKIAAALPGNKIEDNTVISAQPNKCIHLYVRCDTPESLKRLHESVNSGAMVTLLQNLFNEILGSAKTVKVTRVFPDDICFMKFYQQCVLQSIDMSDNMLTHPLLRNGQPVIERVFKNDKTLEKIKESIVLKAFIWRMAGGRKLYSRPDREALNTLSSVCRDWRKITEADSFKETVKTSRKKIREKYQSITLECLAHIAMDQEITCIGTLLDEVYVGTKEYKSQLFLYDYNKFESTEPMQQEPAQITDVEPVKRRPESTAETGERITLPSAEDRPETSEPSPGIKKEKKQKVIIKEVKQDKLEKIEIADGIDISSVESDDDQTGLFCISRTDNSVWFWARSETGNKATAYKQFSPCTNITISPTAKGNLRIVVLKDRNAVEMHNPSSELIQMMFLPDHVKKVNDILCNKDGLLIVCYGSDDNPLHRVSLIHRTGLKALLTYGNECGNGANELNNPSSIALDQENEILYVVDKGNERIVALDKHMDLINVVLDSKYNGAGGPVAVRFSKGSQRLLVAYKDAVEVFKVNRKLQPQQAQPQQQEIQTV